MEFDGQVPIEDFHPSQVAQWLVRVGCDASLAARIEQGGLTGEDLVMLHPFGDEVNESLEPRGVSFSQSEREFLREVVAKVLQADDSQLFDDEQHEAKPRFISLSPSGWDASPQQERQQQQEHVDMQGRQAQGEFAGGDYELSPMRRQQYDPVIPDKLTPSTCSRYNRSSLNHGNSILTQSIVNLQYSPSDWKLESDSVANLHGVRDSRQSLRDIRGSRQSLRMSRESITFTMRELRESHTSLSEVIRSKVSNSTVSNAHTIGGSHDDGPGQSEGAKQTQQSLAHIDRVKAQSIESVTSIRVQADNAENQRRIREEDNRQNRLRRLQEEAIESGKRNAAVEMRWQE